LRGTVVDSDGLPVPGVTMTIASESLIGGAQVRTTDADGRYSFVSLPPGQYNLTATKAGFQSLTVTSISVDVNRTTTQNLTMPLSGQEEVVEVKASARTVDVEDVTRGEVLTKEFLQRIPT